MALREKIEDFVKRLQWKALFYLDSYEDNNCVKKEVYNLKFRNTPPNNKLLDPFEADLVKLIIYIYIYICVCVCVCVCVYTLVVLLFIW